jgi:cobalt-zinc-cadmium efflux system membrane fusion protein
MRNIDRILSALAVGITVASSAGCGSKADADSVTSRADTSRKDSSLALPAEQRERIGVAVIEPSSFHRIVQTTGTVEYDGDQSTQILAPISGPVTRILVQPGVRVHRGEALA